MNGTMSDNANELFPTVDDQGNVTGCVTRGEAHGGSMILHPVVHLHVFNAHGDLFLQHRPVWKDIQPGKWDTACGGHVAYGETVELALSREVSEELGITDFTPKFIGRYIFESSRERELVNVHITTYSGIITPDANELDGGRFWSRAEILANIGSNVFTPNFESEYLRFFSPSPKHHERED